MKLVVAETNKAAVAGDALKVGLAQIAPVWLNRAATLEKVHASVEMAANEGCDLVAFGEALVPGYPFWVEQTDGARFNDDLQKELYALYLDQGVVIERGDLQALCDLARTREIAVYLGVMERAPDRGGHTLYASLVFISKRGEIGSVHRKLQPTYEERLVWGAGDGHGLRTHALGAFTAGGLNCWENWLPLARSAMYAQGDDLHVSVWPGNAHNTSDITRFIAMESRSYVMAVSGLMRLSDIPDSVPCKDLMNGDLIANGGSALAAPDGSWVIEPFTGEEALLVADIDHEQVRRERQNLDVAGHYSRPDVTQLIVDTRRQATARFKE